MEASIKENLETKNQVDQDLILDSEFLPIPKFFKLMAERELMPYKSSFSFKAYIDTISDKLCTACSGTKSALLPIIDQNEALIAKGIIDTDQLAESKEFKTLVSLAVPSMIFKDEKNFICPPFTKKFLATTPAFDGLFGSLDWEIDISSVRIHSAKNNVHYKAGIHILNKFYNQDFPLSKGEVFKIKHRPTGREKYHQINHKYDFMEIVNVKPIPKLDQDTINMIIKTNTPETWLKYLPADTFEFHGFVVGNLYDITETEVIANFKHELSSKPFEDYQPKVFLEKLEVHIKSYLDIEEVHIGNLSPKLRTILKNNQLSITGKDDLKKLLSKNPEDNKGVYDYLVEKKAPVYIEDLNELKHPSKSEKLLMKKGFRSILLSPVIGEDDSIEALMEFGTSKPGIFNSFSTDKMSKIFEILDLGYKKFTNELENQTSSVIQKNFTSIHPSVQWKFEEVTYDYFSQLQAGIKETEFKPVVFNDVYPLYGQADIVGSSSIRNEAISKDLMTNLSSLSNLLENWIGIKEIHLLSAYKCQIDKQINHIKKNFVSTDESNVVNFLINDIHPVLKKLALRHPELNNDNYTKYLNKLDDELGIVYDRRKQFEQSVMRINHSISDFLEMEENKMQKLLPHFFEKYKTDGVEFNLYLGQSLLQNTQFYKSDIKNFKIWQLTAMCELTKLVSNLSPNLSIPLTTAQLIFVYNNTLSIRFRMDEKKFDVDGAYNIRYEILKKRIDKAKIEGTDERLTQAGTISIVYLTNNDKTEYLDFLDFLIEKKLIDPKIEDLNLAKLQGAEGLKALRVKVLTE